MEIFRPWVVLTATFVIGVLVYIFRRPDKGVRPAMGQRKLLNYGGIHVDYYECGKGETVVLLAALGRSVSDFNELVRHLSHSGFRTIAVELKGVGKTSQPSMLRRLTLHDYAHDVSEVIRRLPDIKGGKAHVIGHALGNRVARTLSKDHPNLIKSVTLIAAGGHVPLAKDVKRAMARVPLGFLPGPVREKNARKALFAPGRDIPGYWMSGWHLRAALAQSMAAMSTPREEWWSGGTAPILILQAEYDVIAPAGNSHAMKTEFGDRVTVVMIPDAGHAMLPEQPVLIAEAIVSFLRQHAG